MCCHPEFAFDVEDVAQRAGMSAPEVIELYCASEFIVACLGFTPGFPFLLGLPEKLATPRRATPRKEVPAGSVGIGGEQTGIYPLPSPGGWNVARSNSPRSSSTSARERAPERRSRGPRQETESR